MIIAGCLALQIWRSWTCCSPSSALCRRCCTLDSSFPTWRLGHGWRPPRSTTAARSATAHMWSATTTTSTTPTATARCRCNWVRCWALRFGCGRVWYSPVMSCICFYHGCMAGFWNIGTLAGEVENPRKDFPLLLLVFVYGGLCVDASWWLMVVFVGPFLYCKPRCHWHWAYHTTRTSAITQYD